MKLKDAVKLLDADVLTPDIYDENFEVNFAFGSDMMSDALMLLRTAPDKFCEHGILLTGLVTRQSIRTAEMLDFQVVLIVRGKTPNENVYQAAKDSGIVLLATKCSMFSASGKLYAQGVVGITDIK